VVRVPGELAGLAKRQRVPGDLPGGLAIPEQAVLVRGILANVC
jgi:hypothetical protein